jgi:hypothetical protein
MKFEEEKMEMEAASQSSSSQVTAQHAPPSLGVAVVGRALPDAAAAAAAAAATPPPPVADAWQRAWRALVPQWNQVRGSLKVYMLDLAPRSRSWFSY